MAMFDSSDILKIAELFKPPQQDDNSDEEEDIIGRPTVKGTKINFQTVNMISRRAILSLNRFRTTRLKRKI